MIFFLVFGFVLTKNDSQHLILFACNTTNSLILQWYYLNVSYKTYRIKSFLVLHFLSTKIYFFLMSKNILLSAPLYHQSFTRVLHLALSSTRKGPFELFYPFFTWRGLILAPSDPHLLKR